MDGDKDDVDTVTVTEIIISIDGNEWMDTENSTDNTEAAQKSTAKRYYESIENVLEEQRSSDPLDQTMGYESGYLPQPPKAKKSKKFKEMNEDPFITVEKFWMEHCCSDHCIAKFTKDEVVQLRSACEALDEYVDGTNRLDLVVLSMIRALVRTKKVRNRSYKAREERTSLPEEGKVESSESAPAPTELIESQKERQKYTCNFMVEGQTVCRSFFLFVHNIGVKRWGRLMKVYKSEGLVEKYHGLCNRKPANTTPLENVQFVVEFLRQYANERAAAVPIRLSNQNPDVKVLPIGESKSSVYDKYVDACRKKDQDTAKVVSKISFNRIWRQCCPNLLTQKPRAGEKPVVEPGQATEEIVVRTVLQKAARASKKSINGKHSEELILGSI